MTLRVVLKCASTDCGAQCVMTRGIIKTQEWSVDNSIYPSEVNQAYNRYRLLVFNCILFLSKVPRLVVCHSLVSVAVLSCWMM